MVPFRSPLGLLPRARGGTSSHPPHLGWAVGVAISLASLQPWGPEAHSRPPFPRPETCSGLKPCLEPNQRANKFCWKVCRFPSILTSSHSGSVPGLEVQGVEEAERRG